MAVTRPNILTNATALQKYAQGVMLLKQEFAGPTTNQFGIPGPNRQISTYDLFVVWHHVAMNTETPPGNSSGRNAAHLGPVFCPWHRFMLRQLEMNLQRVLNDAAFGLPYWDWAADGELAVANQAQSPLWQSSAIGGSGFPVSNGPFRFDAGNPASFRIKLEIDSSGDFVQADRGLERSLAGNPKYPDLPTKAQTTAALALTPYDAAPWSSTSDGFRNRLEGWQGIDRPALHNRVHVWVGGDMSPSTSPNDPVFYLNHCNVDRLWEAWMTQNGRVYLPPASAPTSLKGHRLNDQLSSLISAPTTPAAVLNVSADYIYDTLAP
jgi:tyrosinase